MRSKPHFVSVFCCVISLQRAHDDELRDIIARHDDVEVKVSSLQSMTYVKRRRLDAPTGCHLRAAECAEVCTVDTTASARWAYLASQITTACGGAHSVSQPLALI